MPPKARARKKKPNAGPPSVAIAARLRESAAAHAEKAAAECSDFDSGRSDSEAAGPSESEDEGADGYRKGGYHPVKPGDKYGGGRYTVLHKLGWGHFSTVWLVHDSQTGRHAALKVQKSADHYTEAARDEIELLAAIAGAEGRCPAGAAACVRMSDSFDHRGPHGRHVCMVFEVLGDNLLSLIKLHNYRGIPLPIVKRITKQVLLGLDYIHRECGIIHTDLKPENVMLTEALRPRPSPAAAPPLPPMRPAPAAQVAAAGGELTKNQKKKLKRKKKRASGWDVPPGQNVDQAASPRQTGEEPQQNGAGASIAAENGHQPRGSMGRPQSVQMEEAEEASEAAMTDRSGPPSSRRRSSVTMQDAEEAAEAGAGWDSQVSGAAPAAAAPDAVGGSNTTAAHLNGLSHPTANGGGGAAAPPEPTADSKRARRGQDLTAAEWAEINARLARAQAKLVDFGNACWVDRHFTDDIQTRQYRSPEVLLGAEYSMPADMWSCACLVFELVTGDLLFEPRSHPDFDKDEDQLALFQELLGRLPRRVSGCGRRARRFFTRAGELRHIRRLRFWPLLDVLTDKYDVAAGEAKALEEFMLPMLEYVPARRATAAEMLRHPWLRDVPAGPVSVEELAAAVGASGGAEHPAGGESAPQPQPQSRRLSRSLSPLQRSTSKLSLRPRGDVSAHEYGAAVAVPQAR